MFKVLDARQKYLTSLKIC